MGEAASEILYPRKPVCLAALNIAGDEAAIGGIERDMARAEPQIADAYGMVVWADSGGGFCGFDDLFGYPKMLRKV